MRIKLAGLIASLASAIAACTTITGPDPSGMSFSDEPLTGKFIWYDLITEDLYASMRFYEELFGWTFEDRPARGGARYVVARDGDVYVAGLLQAKPLADGQNVSRWLPYVSVSDVDDAVARSIAAGATVAAAARDVALGRVAAIIDSEGAVVGLAESDIGDPDDRTTRAAPGRTVWTELLANDPARAAAFYRAITGYSVSEIERRGGRYTILSSAGADRAGILEKPSPQIASTWLTHYGVADPDAAADHRARQLGGTVVVPASPDLRDDTMAIVTDPAGAVLVLHRVES